MKLKFFIILIIISCSFIIFAEDLTKAEEIAKKYYDLRSADSEIAKVIMVLINEKGDKKNRIFMRYYKKTSDGNKSLIEFLEPADISGTKFLTVSYNEGKDSQWLFLPALGKVRRISSSNRNGSFMSSDISYYDLEDFNFNDFDYQYIGEKKFGDMDCEVIEQYPKDNDAPYSKQIIWINKKDSFAYKLECYDNKRKDRLIKNIVIVEVKIIDGIISPVKFVIEDVIKNTKTLLQNTKLEINVDVNEDLLTIQGM